MPVKEPSVLFSEQFLVSIRCCCCSDIPKLAQRNYAELTVFGRKKTVTVTYTRLSWEQRKHSSNSADNRLCISRERIYPYQTLFRENIADKKLEFSREIIGWLNCYVLRLDATYKEFLQKHCYCGDYIPAYVVRFRLVVIEII